MVPVIELNVFPQCSVFAVCFSFFVGVASTLWSEKMTVDNYMIASFGDHPPLATKNTCKLDVISRRPSTFNISTPLYI